MLMEPMDAWSLVAPIIASAIPESDAKGRETMCDAYVTVYNALKRMQGYDQK